MSDRSITPRRASLAMALVLLASSDTGARTEDRRQVAEIDAGHFVQEADSYRYSQGVEMVQGSLRINAETATVMLDERGEITRIELSGAPVVWRETLTSGEPLVARARKIDYDLSRDQVLLREQVVIERGPDEISGEQVRYDLSTERLDAGGDEGRIRMRITPRSETPQDEQ